MGKFNISKKEFEIVKGYLQSQILIETLDEIEYDNVRELKYRTKNFLNYLKIEVEPILTSMYKSNPDFFVELTNKLRLDIESINKYFNICQ